MFTPTLKRSLNHLISYTVKTHKHIPYSFAYLIKCDFDNEKSEFRTLRGPDAHKVFVESIENGCKSIYDKYLKKNEGMTPLTLEEQSAFYQAKQCHICDRAFNKGEKRVADHCHLSGKFQGPAHSICNL